MRVCSVIDTLQYGGAEALLLEITRRAEFDHVVCYRRGEGERAPEFEQAGATVEALNFNWQYDPLGIIRLSGIVSDCDIVHGHLPASISIARIAGSAVNTPIVSTHHNMPSTYGTISGGFERFTRSLDDATVGVSEGVVNAHDGENWKTIHNGIDVEKFREDVSISDTNVVLQNDLGNNNHTLLNIARYTKQKSQFDLISMIPELEKYIQDVHLILVGHGPLEGELRDHVSDLGVGSQVTVTGRVPEVEPYYSIADVFVSASAEEGLPITFLEAMAAELPIVATDIPGVREVVIDGETGILVPHNKPTRLARAVNRIFEHIQGYKQASYSHVHSNFHVDSTVNEYQMLYQDLV